MSQSPFMIEEDKPQPTVTTINRTEELLKILPMNALLSMRLRLSRPFSPLRLVHQDIVAAHTFSIGIIGWLVSVGNWVIALSQTHWLIGVAGGVSVAAATIGALLWIGSELRSLRQLQTVDKFTPVKRGAQRRTSFRSLIADIGRALPSTPATVSAIASWTRMHRVTGAVKLSRLRQDGFGALDAGRLPSCEAPPGCLRARRPQSDYSHRHYGLYRARDVPVRAIAEVYGHRPLCRHARPDAESHGLCGCARCIGFRS